MIKRWLSTAVAFLLVAGWVFAQSAAPGGGAPSGWGIVSGIATSSLDVTIAGILGDSRILQVGNATSNHGGVIKSYANPGVINSMEFRVPGNSTLKGYFYADATQDMLVTGAFKSENTKVRGTITLAAGTGTATVLTGAICTCTDSTANASVKCAVAATTLTATGTGTDVISYHCL